MPPTRTKSSAASALCSICKETPQKYKCPTCGLPYCSVVCFKVHKESCGKPAKPSADGLAPEDTVINTSHTDSALPPLLPPHPTAAARRHLPTEPLRPLSSLAWPPEPDPMIFLDPLRSSEPKPLKRDEYMAIATSAAIRQVLTARKDALRPVLQALEGIKDSRVKGDLLAKALGLDKDSLARVKTVAVTRDEMDDSDGFYIPNPAGGEGQQRIWFAKNERVAMREFADAVRAVLEKDQSGNKVEYEV